MATSGFANDVLLTQLAARNRAPQLAATCRTGILDPS